ncbi:MAG: prepilin-type N-terminal cleavage/methylation domain-containing protein [Thermodesulfobacteriota bacterium]|nr:prepilin-type N-terminal cleavage/methylation domain-containing protein [Thermodesulfobacteriota bacterium]
MIKMRNLLSKREGFTLLEVLISMSVLSMGLLGVAAMSVYVSQGNAQARKVTAATVLAQSQLEAFKDMAYASITTGSDSNNPVDESGNAGGIYTRTWTVTDNVPYANVKKVECTVSWGSDSISLYTLIAR